MNQWHYNNNGQQTGPITTDELKAKIAAGELTRSSLVWKVGTTDWVEIGSLTELVTFIQQPPPLPKSVTVAATSRSAFITIIDAVPAIFVAMMMAGILLSVAIPQFEDNRALISLAILIGIGLIIWLISALIPVKSTSSPSIAWRRFAAKIIDGELASLAALIVVFAISPELGKGLFLAFIIVFFAVWFIFEVVMKGKTLGRYLFGVQLEPITTNPDYFLRFIKMMFFGMALSFPLAVAISNTVAYKRFRESGTTTWDKDAFQVSIKNGGVGRLILGLVLIIFFMTAVGFLSNLKKADIGEVNSNGQTISSAPMPAITNRESAANTSLTDQGRVTGFNEITGRKYSYPINWSARGTSFAEGGIYYNFSAPLEGDINLSYYKNGVVGPFNQKITKNGVVSSVMIGEVERTSYNGYKISIMTYEKFGVISSYFVRIVIEHSDGRGYWNFVIHNPSESRISLSQCDLVENLIGSIDGEIDAKKLIRAKWCNKAQ